jgi:hypothetical protein
LAIRPVPGSKTVSSSSVMPIAITVAPVIWLRAVFSLSTRPPSFTDAIRATRSTPRSRSTRTSAKAPAGAVADWAGCGSIAPSMTSSSPVASQDVAVGLTRRPPPAGLSS